MRNITVADHFYCWILPAFCVMGKRAFLFKRNSTDPSQTCFLARVLARCLVLPCFIQSTGRRKIRYPSTPGGFPYWQLNLDPPLSKCQGLELPNGGMSTDADGAYSRGTHTQGDYPMGWPEMLVFLGLSAWSSSLIGWRVHKGYRLTAWKEWAFHTFYS